MATILKLDGVNAVGGGELNLNGANTGMASVELLPGWRPRVAKRRRGQMGNQALFDDVLEMIPLRVFGASELECLATLSALAAAMDQAVVWREGAAISAVSLKYAIHNTALANPLEAAVLGSSLEAADILSLPVTFNQFLQVFEVNPVQLPVLRRGLWLGDEESQVSSSTGENPTVVTASFTGSLMTPSPVKVNIEFTNGNGNLNERGTALAFISDDADKLYVAKQLIGVTSGTSGLTMALADADASDNQVLEIVPNDTTEILIQPNVDGSLPSTAGDHLYMMFMVVQNLSASVTWDVYQISYYTQGSTMSRLIPMRSVRIGADNTSPQIVKLGPFALSHPISLDATGATMLGFYLRPSAGSGAGHELKIDSIAVVELDGGVTALTLRDLNYTTGDNQVKIDHQLLTRPKPSVLNDSLAGGSEHAISYDGVPLIFNNSAEISCLVLGTQDDNWLLGWAPTPSTFDPVDVGIKATRQAAYLIPR
ncbi:MAG: hypothetical protein KC413_00770 [Anaerolineales bacterium]|nr:hypothetical protein [Anaerolineales bacterium]